MAAPASAALDWPVPPACLLCGTPTPEPGCCSATCASRAHLEVQRNAARLRTAALTAEDRRALAERNGRLTSILLQWQRKAG
ncbi:hypothetical protein [Egicoccus sp. AB-alg6-2]|uniref:hypothetical protein n=1 Tax=Egicoccus sp. AB-alg6-2 TaxID=3242692 RepID=UPI00359EC224